MNKDDLEEMKCLWLNDLWSIQEIAEWFGISKTTVVRYVKRIEITQIEYFEKEAEFAEILKLSRGRKSLVSLAEKGLERLKGVTVT